MTMTHSIFVRALPFAVGLQFVMAIVAQTVDLPKPQNTLSKMRRSIPLDQIGAKAGTNYQGDGLTVAATEKGARLVSLRRNPVKL